MFTSATSRADGELTGRPASLTISRPTEAQTHAGFRGRIAELVNEAQNMRGLN